MQNLTFLEEGAFTPIDKVVREKAKELEAKAKEKNTSIFLELSLYLHSLEAKNKNFSEFRKRDSSEIIESNYRFDCTDLALVDLSILRSLGYPSIYIETIKEDCLKDPKKSILGHVFTKVKLNQTWKLRDPYFGFRAGERYNLKTDTFIPLAQGLDFSELYTLNTNNKIEISSLDQASRLLEEYRKLK